MDQEDVKKLIKEAMNNSNNLSSNSAEIHLSQQHHKDSLKELEDKLRNEMEEMRFSHTKMLEDQQHAFQQQLEHSQQEFQDQIQRKNEHFTESFRAQEDSIALKIRWLNEGSASQHAEQMMMN